MRKNHTQMAQDSSGRHGSTVVTDLVGNDNGNRHSSFPTHVGGRIGRRKMRIVGKCSPRRQCNSLLPIKEKIKLNVESANVETVSVSAPSLAPAALSPTAATLGGEAVELSKEKSKSAIPCRDSADTVVSPQLSTVERVDRVRPGQKGSLSDTHIGDGQSLANRHRSRQSITATAVPSSVGHSDDWDSANSGRSSSSSSSCRSSSSMSFSSDSNVETKKTASLVSMVVRSSSSSSSDDQVTIKREVDYRKWNDSKEDDLIVIDYTRTSRYPEKKVFDYSEYERSLLLEAAAKMVNGGQLQEQSTFKIEETTETNIEQQQQPYQESSNSSGSSNPFSTSSYFTPKTKDDEDRKLFIGGLSFDTSECDLEKYFSRFGIVDGVNLKYDPETGISRCFAFISFAEEEAAEEVLRQPMHIINGRWVEPRRAKSRPVYKKLFVGGIDGSLSTDDIRDYFSRFGKVAQVDIPFDRMSQQRRHFCFVIFQTEEAAEEAAMWPRQMIKSRLLDVRRTVPSNVLAQQKRMAQAAGLDLNEYDCNYKLGKMNATARMVTASAAMAAAALATPITPHFIPNHFPMSATPFPPQVTTTAAPAAGPSCPQMSVTATGAIIPFADHISQASMAALGVANQPHAYPAAVTFSSNLYPTASAPMAPTYYTTPTAQAYAYPYMNTASYAPTVMYHAQHMTAASPHCLSQPSYNNSTVYGYPASLGTCATDYSGYYSQFCQYNSQQAQPPPQPPPPVESAELSASQMITSSSGNFQSLESDAAVGTSN